MVSLLDLKRDASTEVPKDRHPARQHGGTRTSGQGDIGKALFDRTSAAAGLLLLLPLFLMIALLIFARDPGPIFYGHRRIGRNGRTFRCLKFRTMVVDSDATLARHLASNRAAEREWAATRKLRHDPRVTRIGQILRRTSLDELPQLINILRGDMSVVGPRPIVEEEVALYGDAFDDYLSVKPGLTGLWQVSGRNDVDYERRVALDRHYVRTRSFRGDLIVILRTIGVVFFQKGSY